ncbi:probable protein phosphatase 2C 23 [Mangifera indica]|uniref:probable protein phosphatase 2C 23 n=1 Tax=Mangifera indica TaxID=29780 RepID=UPI001CF9CCA3|nr:probable protein phosphatase 2C 23 [Mangifera indica]
MGNGVAKLGHCFTGHVSRRHDIAVILGDPLDGGLGHSFCYVPSEQLRLYSSKVHSEFSTNNVLQTTPFFHSISGASVSANVSTQTLSMALVESCPYNTSSIDRASTFESSDSFASLPLQPVPRSSFQSGSGASLIGSGPIERGFLSGPIERGFVSGPIDRGVYSGPMVDKEKDCDNNKLQRSLSQNNIKENSQKQRLMKVFKRVLSISHTNKSCKRAKEMDSERNNESVNGSSIAASSNMSLNNEGGVIVEDNDDDFSLKSQNLQWAQGKAGEDRVHIVLSEKHGWVFVGIYDGFNGPDAPDYLLNNLYAAVHKELKGLLWNEKLESTGNSLSSIEASSLFDKLNQFQIDKENNHPLGNSVIDENSRGKKKKNGIAMAEKWEENQKRWRCEWDRERLELDRKSKEKSNCEGTNGVNHSDVLKALSLALKKTEDSFLEVADLMVRENPELALMGSCVLVMLMKGEDVYLMNVGDSRAVLAKKLEPNIGLGRQRKDLERIKEETMHDLETFDDGEIDRLNNLTSIQLTIDHSTYVEEEVCRIKKEHPDDDSAVMNDRVKGYLKVTRAFGAGFLKQPKWNDALLEMFRIDYIGTSPYITCLPWLCHHRLSPRDKFLILSSDGLYQYFTNEEAVSEVELFIAAFPEGDPAQHLIEEVLFRAAKKAGIDFHELLEIPQGDRRRYHDDVTVIVISFEGRIWRSSV